MRPENFNTLFGKAVECHVSGRLAEALSSYETVIRRYPNAAAAHCNRALVLQSLNRLEDSLKGYNRALALEPRYTDAHFNKAIVLRQLGRLEEAIRSYDQAIRYQPDHFEAHNNRGNALRDLDRPEEALESFDRAIRLKPGFAYAHYNKAKVLHVLGRLNAALGSIDCALALQPEFADAHLAKGNTLQQLERFDEALQSFNRAIELQPRNPDVHFAKGRALYRLRRLDEALQSYECAILLKPAFTDVLNDKGNVLEELKRFDEALQCYEQAIRTKPDRFEAHNNRGNVLRAMKRFSEAARSFDEAIKLSPDSALLHYNKANVLLDQEQLDLAVQSYDRAIALKPDYVDALNNRGNALKEQMRFDEALRSYDAAIELSPIADAYFNRANALIDLNRPKEALRSFDRAIALEPNSVAALYNKGMCALLSGNWEEGWPLYEWRKKKAEPAGLWSTPEPEWTGNESLAGQTLLIHAEQGLGDTIQFCRYALLAQQRGAKVILVGPDALARLLKTLHCDIGIESPTAELVPFDCHIALMSMPLALNTTTSTCPADVPYLRAEPERVEKWKERLGPHGFKIGICWQGNKQSGVDTGRSFSVRHFEAIARCANVRLISLQKNDGVEQLCDLPADMSVETLGDDFDAGPDAFVDTAAVMECLDLVITSDTAIAHLAGALARPTWVALKYIPDWRWLLDRSDSPWYPTMKLFRQPAHGDWASVFTAMEAHLAKSVARAK